MSLQVKERHKINFGAHSERGESRPQNNDNYGKFPVEHSELTTPKGQLFLVADSKTRNPNGKNAGEMAIGVIQKNYFSYPSDDIAFSLQRAFDTANRYIYQYAQAAGLHRRIGATCSALVLTERMAYIAHVGDCRVYRVSIRKVEQLTHDHLRVIEMMPPDPPHGAPGKPVRRSALTRALGVKLGIKIDMISKIPVHRDEYFILCSDGLKNVPPEEIQQIVLSSAPDRAAYKLANLARERGGKDDVTVQVIKVYNHYIEEPLEMYAHISEPVSRWSNWPIYFMLVILTTGTAFLMHEPLLRKASALVSPRPVEYSLVDSELNETVDPRVLEQEQLGRAREYFNKGRWEEALKEYKAVLRSNATQSDALEGIEMIARAYTVRGDRAYSKENWGAALYYYKKALKLNPQSASLRNLVVRSENALYEAQQKLASQSPATRSLSLRHAEVDIPPAPEASGAPVIRGITPAQWHLAGLDAENDFRLMQDKLIFVDNLRIKKAFHREIYDGVEVEVQARRLRGSLNGKYGIIIGHNLNAAAKPANFMLFTVDSNGHFSLQYISPRSVKILVSEPIKPGIVGNFDQIHLKVKSYGKMIFLYANGVLLKMQSVEIPLTGGVGLYVDPKMRVEFSGFAVLPIENERY